MPETENICDPGPVTDDAIDHAAVSVADDLDEVVAERLGAARVSLQPGDLLVEGRRDPARLLVLWYVRKSAWWMGFVGVAVAYWLGRADEVAIDITDTGRVWREVRSPLIVLVAAFVIRLTNNIINRALAFPMMLEYERHQTPRTGHFVWITKWLDRRNLLAGFGRIRMSHHVRQEALRRLGPTGERVARLDGIIDRLNVITFVLMSLVVVLVRT